MLLESRGLKAWSVSIGHRLFELQRDGTPAGNTRELETALRVMNRAAYHAADNDPQEAEMAVRIGTRFPGELRRIGGR